MRRLAGLALSAVLWVAYLCLQLAFFIGLVALAAPSSLGDGRGAFAFGAVLVLGVLGVAVICLKVYTAVVERRERRNPDPP